MIGIAIRRMVRKFGADIEWRRPTLVDLLALHDVDTVLDVGANVGQFARRLRAWGYRGRIISFEPLRGPFERLRQAAARDPRWQAVNVALGDEDTSGRINVSEATVFSSMLAARPVLRQIWNSAATVRVEEVTIRRLDSILPELESTRQPWRAPFLKIDTQGFERHVLHGAVRSLPRMLGVQLEASLTPLYEDEASFGDMLRLLERAGFDLARTEPVAHDPSTGAALQLDCVFLARPSPPADAAPLRQSAGSLTGAPVAAEPPTAR